MLIGDRIKELRNKLGWSQAELAYKIGTDSTTISRWETNRIRVSQGYILKLSNALGTSADYLLGDTDDPALQQRDAQNDPPAEEHSVIDKNIGTLSYEFKDGDKLELPATKTGYALFEKIVMGKLGINVAAV